ncbi:AMP-binding protein [Variovorax sp. J22P168]|uniref:AMP-binding protein n=1 Tax=Variovorax jilinensis TaxID=3053513 RepID=UPI00257737CC|nr:AMP-binding protein [Variovorax sp. J22P168]MDM0015145.1 AMP-binding protein [Variovorax sp. J22P168]
MEFDPVLARQRAKAMRDDGQWNDQTIHDYFSAALAAFPDKTAIADHASRSAPTHRLTYRELDALAERIAASLTRMGIRRGEVVSVQLQNCWQYLAIALACARTGVAINPLMPIFRERELEFMLNLCESSVFIVPATFKGRDHAGMVRALRPRLPRLRHLIVVGEDGEDGFDRILLNDSLQSCCNEAARPSSRPLHPDEVALVMFTSGTTGEPKGVMHTSNTMLSTLSTAMRSLEMTPGDVALCAAPMGHLLGFALLGVFPFMFKGTTVIMDSWDVDQAVRLMVEERVTFTAGPTPYLADLCNAVAKGAARPSSLRVFCCAGAPIPPVLIERADTELNMTVCSLWGMTEVQAGLITEIGRGRAHSALADGRPPPGMEARIVDDASSQLPVGQTGRLQVRGSGVFAGYLKHPEWNDTDSEGWFDTGDLAYVVNDGGDIRINGRSKDIIKRGGESVPVVEVEALLARHPAVSAVAIVGWPDARLGERVCAFITLRDAATFNLDEMQRYLRACKLTPQYWPERIELRDDLPRTPSGKVQKFKLRELVQTLTDKAT